MTMKTWGNICKGIAIVQAITAPVLMMYGHITNKKTIRNVGAVWCGLVCLDTARTVTDAIDTFYKYEGKELDEIDHNDVCKERA